MPRGDLAKVVGVAAQKLAQVGWDVPENKY
jgi:hypothetical protein